MGRSWRFRSGANALRAVLVTLLFLSGTALLGATVVGLPGAHIGGAATTHAPALVIPNPTHAATHPSVGNVSASVVFTSAFVNYLQLPYNLQFKATITNATVVGPWQAGAANTWINVEIRDVASICTGGLGTVYNCPTVVNITLNDTVTNGSTSWNTTLTSNALLGTQFRVSCPAGGPACPYNGGILPNDQYQILAWVNINNSVSNLTFGAEQTAYLVSTPPSAVLDAPSGLGAVSTGNTSVAITYQGSYLGGAQVSIYQGTSGSGTVVYTASLFIPQPNGASRTAVATTVWYVATPGAYFVSIALSTPYGTSYSNSSLTVVAAGQTVYHNASSWSNSTLIPGVTSAVAGTILLVVGLIVGMIVALMLGRMMWGGAPKASPAQPWQSKGANECSVCHQTFATEAELKEHQKSAHGMS